jgi:uncharacterized membrane protein YeiH
MPTPEQFQLSMRYELAAVFLFAVTGALLAIEKRYDFVGVFGLALLSATGGGLLRDSFFLQRGAPQVLQDERYLYAVAVATVVCLIAGTQLTRFRYVFLVADALGLGIYAVVGTERAIDAGLHVVPAAFVGIANAVGGGVLRDVLTGQETLLFKPGQFYVLAAASGTVVFTMLITFARSSPYDAAWWAIGATFVMRLAAITLNWKTRAATPLFHRPPAS